MRLLRTIRDGSALLFLLLLVLLFSPAVPRIASALASEWGDGKGDILVVPGAEQLGDGTIGISSYWRSVYAVRAYRQHQYRKIIVSGGPPGRSIAAEMASFMIASGIPREVIVTEDKSGSTRENALFSAGLLKSHPGKVVLLTSDYHTRRAALTFRKAGVAVDPAPFPDLLKRWNYWPHRVECITIVAIELAKTVYYQAKGWL